MNLTNEQRSAVTHRGSSVIVSASAGSGKTEVLAQRCLSLVADPKHPCAVSQLLVLTFTRAAASELRVRVARSLHQAAEGAAPSDGAYLRRQAALIDAAEIGTIDAWCQRVVRDNAERIGVDPAFRIFDEQEAAILRRGVLDECCTWAYSSDEPAAVAARSWMERSIGPTDAFLREHIMQLNRFREQLLDPLAWMKAQADRAERSDSAQRLEAQSVLAETLQAECRLQAEALNGHTRQPLAGYRQLLLDSAERLENPVELLDVAERLEEFGWPRKADPADAEHVNEARRWKKRISKTHEPQALREMLEDSPKLDGLVRVLIELEGRYDKALTRAKHDRSAYEFADVQRFALDLLGEPDSEGARRPTVVAMRLRARFEHVLIDECQDTSPVQIELLRLVTRPERERTNCFMVGDVKQSIYGFRQADPRLFAQFMSDFDAGISEGVVRYLSDSFRSHPDIIQAINAVFGRLFDDRFGGARYGEKERLRAARNEIANGTLEGAARVRLCVLDDPSEPRRDEEADSESDAELLVDDRLEREARWIAQEIRKLLPVVQVPESGPNGSRLRSARLSDFAILLRSAMVNAGKVASILRDEGVAAATIGREAFLDTTEGRDVICALRVVANRRQELPLAAFLRSPFVGLSESDLLAIRRATERGDFSDACEYYLGAGESASADSASGPLTYVRGSEWGPLREKLAAAFALLDRWSRAARDEDMPTLIDRMLREAGYELFAAGASGGGQRVATLNAIREFARQFSVNHSADLASFVEHLDRVRALNAAPMTSVVAATDAVRIMTIHQAKGLEFPFVFLASAGASFNRDTLRRSLICDVGTGIGLRFFDFSERRMLKHATQVAAVARRRRQELEEELRLLYVAATRAREALWIVGHGDLNRRFSTGSQSDGGTLPVLLRLTANCMLDWVRMSVQDQAPGETGIATVAIQADTIEPSDRETIPTSASVDALGLTEFTAPDEWLARGISWLRAAGSDVRRQPAVISVSALKELALRDRDAERPALLERATSRLDPPAFLQAEMPDGRAVGVAVHRFLQHVDLRRIASRGELDGELARLRERGAISDAEAALIPLDSLVWLAGTQAGEALRRHADRARREVPFVLLLPGAASDRVLTRGVMDCVIEHANSIDLIDYKTDRLSSEEARLERLSIYGAQLSLYSHAAERIFGKPVDIAWLVFLNEQRLERIDPSAQRIDEFVARL